MSTTTVPTHPTTTAPAASDAAAIAEHRLRTVLRVDAAASAATGVLLAAAPDAADRILGTGNPLAVRLVGVAFIAYALDVALVSRASRPGLRRWSGVVAIANEVYVIGTVAAIALGAFSTGGAVVAAAVGAFVGTLAVGQWRFRRDLARARS